MSDVKVVNVEMFDKPLKGISICSGDMVTVIGKRTVDRDGNLIEQYLYNIEGYIPQNNLPFVSLLCNIHILNQ